ncbi:OB-fold tRNA/helicase-type nucleic acid binding protein [Streptomyces solisilvae]|uniref:OB-fold tRNA/helicase-type nucleic acid binding protein n=1 Tax=Streptomyces malaysiensis TaxID=92644 RepID=UPI0036B1DF93
MTMTQPEKPETDELYDLFFGFLDDAEDDSPAPVPVPMVAGSCSCGEAVERPLGGPRPACTHEGTTHPDGSTVVGGYRVKPDGRGRCFNDRHDVDGVALFRAGNTVPQCADCVAARLGVQPSALPVAAGASRVPDSSYTVTCDGAVPPPEPAPEAGGPWYFEPPRPSRFDGGVFFAAVGNVYALRRAEGGGWDAVALSGGLAGPVHGRTQAEAIGRVWEMTGAHRDVPAPVIKRWQGTNADGIPEARVDVVCAGQGLYLRANPHRDRDPWAEPCHRCNGRGYLEAYQHVKGGICFECDGDRIGMSYTLEEASAHVRRKAREARTARDKRALDGERKRRRWARFTEARPEAAVWLEAAAARGSDFAGELRGCVLAGHELTAGQVRACEDAARKDYARDLAQAHAEQERRERVRRSRAAGAEGETVTVRGTVARAWRYTSGPHYRPQRKCGVVVDDGAGVSVVMFTSAKAAFALGTGDTVTVTGTVKDPENRDRDTGEIQTLIRAPKFSDHERTRQSASGAGAG